MKTELGKEIITISERERDIKDSMGTKETYIFLNHLCSILFSKERTELTEEEKIELVCSIIIREDSREITSRDLRRILKLIGKEEYIQ